MPQSDIISSRPYGGRPRSPLVAELSGLFDVPDDGIIVATILAYRPRAGRPGWDPHVLWRSYVAAFYLGLPTTAALIRHLEDSAAIRHLCGFEDTLPSRPTFTRFFSRLAYHRDVVDEVLVWLTSELHERLPGFGRHVAVDATVVRSWSNPRQGATAASDPDASWTATTGGSGRPTFRWGMKLTGVVDATYELPLAYTMVTAKRHDTTQFIPVLERARKLYPWFDPTIVSADAGYLSQRSYVYLGRQLGAVPIMKRSRSRKHHLPDHPDVPYGGIAWRQYYADHQAIERMWSRLRLHRTLGTHCRRTMKRVALHCALSMIALQATAVAAVRADQLGAVTVCTRKVA